VLAAYSSRCRRDGVVGYGRYTLDGLGFLEDTGPALFQEVLQDVDRRQVHPP
jgi:hypothetical protein